MKPFSFVRVKTGLYQFLSFKQKQEKEACGHQIFIEKFVNISEMKTFLLWLCFQHSLSLMTILTHKKSK
jgi:hypothetical protein